MVNQVIKTFDDINLDWARGFITYDAESITITVKKLDFPDCNYSDGYSYRAHIKLDSKATWRENIPDNAKPWEVKQRDTPLWEICLGADYNYDPEPWKSRPPIARVVGFLKEKGVNDIADRIAEVYQQSV